MICINLRCERFWKEMDIGAKITYKLMGYNPEVTDKERDLGVVVGSSMKMSALFSSSDKTKLHVRDYEEIV